MADRRDRSFVTNSSVVLSVVALFSIFLAATLEGRADSFSFSSFPASTSGIQTNGSATLGSGPSGDRLRLTPNSFNKAGSAYYNSLVNVQAGFTTQFQFLITDSSGLTGGADGLTFIIQNSPNGTAALGSYGGSIGYGGIPNSLVVEFDTYKNSEYSDPDSNHIAVHTNGTGVNSPSSSTLLGSYSPSVSFKDGQVHTVKIDYSGTTLSVYFDNLTSPVLSVNYDLSNLGLNGGKAYVGFTAATGGEVENHDILSWTFQSAEQPTTVPEPATIALFGTGLAGVAGAARRRRRGSFMRKSVNR